MTQSVDCLIVGGGPAGLTAAIYVSRFHLKVMIVDAGDSRAAQIPCTHNHAGFPDGIAGVELLRRMREQAVKYGSLFSQGEVRRLSQTADGFAAQTSAGDVLARSVLIATGVTNIRPPMPDDLHSEAVGAGRLRYCPVCDGYEVTGQNVVVLGSGAKAMKEAEFLRSYTSTVSLVPLSQADGFDDEQLAHLSAIGVKVLAGPACDFKLESNGLSLMSGSGRVCFEAAYPALGSKVHSALAVSLGAKVTEDGCIKTDAHQRTSVAGLYAAGDVVIGLDQISHAMGEAGVAATAIRNDLAAQKALLWK